MAKLFDKGVLCVTLLFFVFFSFLGKPLMSEASERSNINTVIISSQCAIAFMRAVEDFENWFASHPQQGFTSFKDYFEEKYGSVKCFEVDGNFLVYFYPRDPGTRGGSVKYLISKNNYKVLERVFDR